MSKDQNKGLIRLSDNQVTLSLDSQLQLAEKIAKSKLTPFTKAEEVLSCMFYAKELKIGYMTALNNMHVVNGKVGLGIHIITAKLRQGGVDIEVLEDYEPVYNYIDIRSKAVITSNLLSELKKQGQKVQIVFYSGTDEDKQKQKQNYLTNYPDSVVVVPMESTYRTVVKFTRQVQDALGNYVTKTHVETLALCDVPADYFTKDNWKKNTKIMLRTRPIVTGARFFASDLISGIYDIAELLDVNNEDYEVDETGEVTIINAKKVKKDIINEELIETVFETQTEVTTDNVTQEESLDNNNDSNT